MSYAISIHIHFSFFDSEPAPAMTTSEFWNTLGMYINIVGEMKLADQLLVMSQILI